MLLFNNVLLFSSLLTGLTRRNIISAGLSKIIMNKNPDDNLENSLENNYKNIYNYKNLENNFNYKYSIPELDSEVETKTIIHTEDNNLYFQGEITPESCFYLQQNLIKLQKIENKYNCINFYIQSGGGSLLPTFGVIDTMKLSKIPVNTYINGYVASAATLLSVSGHKRFISKNSMMLIHSLRTVIGEVNYQQLEDNYYNSASMMNIVKNIYKDKSTIDNNQLEYLLQHDYWLNSTECLKYKFIDYII